MCFTTIVNTRERNVYMHTSRHSHIIAPLFMTNMTREEQGGERCRMAFLSPFFSVWARSSGYRPFEVFFSVKISDEGIFQFGSCPDQCYSSRWKRAYIGTYVIVISTKTCIKTCVLAVSPSESNVNGIREEKSEMWSCTIFLLFFQEVWLSFPFKSKRMNV